MPTASPVLIFGTRVVWDLSWPCGKLLSKFPSLHHTLKALRCVGTFETSVSHLTDSQLYWINCQLSVFVPFLYPAVMAQPHEPANAAADSLQLLTTALKLLMPNQWATNFRSPTFEWTTSKQYDEFKLFCESTESWFHLLTIPDESDDKGALLECIQNFHGTPGCQRWNQWTPASVTTDDIAATKKSAKSFLDHLASQMHHTESQWCLIYQLEDVQIKPGETPDELVDHLRALVDRCNFPTDEERDQNVWFHLVHAFTDSELV